MAEVVAQHMLADDDTCGCTCDEMFYDWRLSAEQIKVEHSMHVEERLAANGYGKLEDAWDEGLSAGQDRWLDSREFGDPPVNPYRRPE